MKESQEATHVNEGVSIGHTYETPHIPGVYMCCLLRLLHAYVLPLGTPGFICVAYWDSFTHMCCDMKCHATDEWQSLQRQHMCSLLGLLHSYVWPIETASRICVATWSVTLQMNDRVSRGNIWRKESQEATHMNEGVPIGNTYEWRSPRRQHIWMKESQEATHMNEGVSIGNTYEWRSPNRQHVWMKESQEATHMNCHTFHSSHMSLSPERQHIWRSPEWGVPNGTHMRWSHMRWARYGWMKEPESHEATWGNATHFTHFIMKCHTIHTCKMLHICNATNSTRATWMHRTMEWLRLVGSLKS